jgi:hypothetical protein
MNNNGTVFMPYDTNQFNYFSKPLLETFIQQILKEDDFEIELVKETQITSLLKKYYKQLEYCAKMKIVDFNDSPLLNIFSNNFLAKIIMEKGKIYRKDWLNFESFTFYSESPLIEGIPSKFKLFLYEDPEEDILFREDYIRKSILSGQLTWKKTKLPQIPSKNLSLAHICDL